MGLDITAYEKLTLERETNNPTDAELDADDKVTLYKLHEFAAATDGMPDGVYAVAGESFGFCAGSYSGYNRWREWLAGLVGKVPSAVWANPQPGPFVELIHNADNEGFIGPKASAKLAKDFADHDELAKIEPPLDRPDYYQAYQSWRKAFEIAARGGAVKLH